MNEYIVIQYAEKTLACKVKANSEQEAYLLVSSGEVEYKECELDGNGLPLIDE